jgi:hypothetical protein
MGHSGTCTNPTGRCECGLAMKSVFLNENVEPLELEPSTPPTIKPYHVADEGNSPD